MAAATNVDSLSSTLPGMPNSFFIGDPKLNYRYSHWHGRVWKCVRAAEGHPTTSPSDTLFLMRLDAPEGEVKQFNFIAVHAPADTPDIQSLLQSFLVVFGSNEDVLIEGNHEWLVYSENQHGWNHLGSFTTTLTQNQRPNLPHRAI